MGERIAKRKFRYRGRAVAADGAVDILPQHERILEATGRLKPQAELGTYRASRPRGETKAEAQRREALDHDRSGKAGGSPKPGPSPELQAARAEYTRLSGGKRFFSGWSLQQIREQIAKMTAQPSDGESTGGKVDAAADTGEAADTSPPSAGEDG